MTDWLRCYLAGVAPFVWTVGLTDPHPYTLDLWTVDGSRVPFFLIWSVLILVHIHRRREKDREQDAELARQRENDRMMAERIKRGHT